jgi:hypothetical protein
MIIPPNKQPRYNDLFAISKLINKVIINPAKTDYKIQVSFIGKPPTDPNWINSPTYKDLFKIFDYADLFDNIFIKVPEKNDGTAPHYADVIAEAETVKYSRWFGDGMYVVVSSDVVNFSVNFEDKYTVSLTNLTSPNYYSNSLFIVNTGGLSADSLNIPITSKAILRDTVNDVYYTLNYYTTGSLLLGITRGLYELPGIVAEPTNLDKVVLAGTPTPTPSETPAPTTTPSETPTPTPTPIIPSYYGVNTNFDVISLSAPHDYIIVDENVNQFDINLDDNGEITVLNSFVPSDLTLCTVTVSPNPAITLNTSGTLYVGDSVSMTGNVNGSTYTLYYFNTGSLILGVIDDAYGVLPSVNTYPVTPTPTPSETPTNTTPTPTPTETETPTPTPTQTETPTPTPTPSVTPPATTYYTNINTSSIEYSLISPINHYLIVDTATTDFTLSLNSLTGIEIQHIPDLSDLTLWYINVLLDPNSDFTLTSLTNILTANEMLTLSSSSTNTEYTLYFFATGTNGAYDAALLGITDTPSNLPPITTFI